MSFQISDLDIVFFLSKFLILSVDLFESKFFTEEILSISLFHCIKQKLLSKGFYYFMVAILLVKQCYINHTVNDKWKKKSIPNIQRNET